MLHKVLRKFAPVAAIAMAAATGGCDRVNLNIGGGDGVKLAELDMTGDAPTRVALASPDTVIIREGDTLAIDVEGDGDAADRMRFSLSDGTLGLMRTDGNWRGSQTAIVRVTMPMPTELTMAGSGKIEAPGLTGEAQITVAGSGTMEVARIDADRLDVNILGSGSTKGAGRTDRLDLNVAGSGSADLSRLEVGQAEVNVMGSGDASFASDGKVEANIMGSGDVTVYGRASCTVNAVGSGTLNCRDAGEAPGTAN